MKRMLFVIIMSVLFLGSCKSSKPKELKEGWHRAGLGEQYSCRGGGGLGYGIEYGFQICVSLPEEYRHLEAEFAECVLEKGTFACIDDLAEGKIEDCWK